MHVGKPPLQRRWTSQLYGWLGWLQITAAGADVTTIAKTLATRQLISLVVLSFFYGFSQGRPNGAPVKQKCAKNNNYSKISLRTRLFLHGKSSCNQIPTFNDFLFDSGKVPAIASRLQPGASSSSTRYPVVYCSTISNSEFSFPVALIYDLTLLLRVDFLCAQVGVTCLFCFHEKLSAGMSGLNLMYQTHNRPYQF